jgi:WD40 repeat protein
VLAIAFDSQGRRLATASADRTVRLWEPATGKELLRLRGHEDAVHSVRFSDDGKRLLTASADRTARVWNTATGEELARLQGHANQVVWSDFLPGEQQVATAGDSTIRLWDFAEPDEISVTLATNTGAATALEFSPDSQRLLTATDDADGGADETARIWDVASGKEVLALGQGNFLGAIRSAQFVAGGTQVLTASTTTKATLNGQLVNSSSVHLWDARSGADLRPELKQDVGAFVAVVSRDGQRIATVTDGYQRTVGRGFATTNGQSGGTAGAGMVRLWNAATGELIRSLPTEVDEACVPQFSPDGRRVLVRAQYEGPARIHEVKTGRELFSLNPQQQSPLADAYSPDGKSIAVSTRDGRVVFYSAADGKPEPAAIEGLARDTRQIVFRPDGQRLVMNLGPTAAVYDVQMRKRVCDLKGHESGILAIAFSGDGKYLLTGSADHSAVLWDAESGRILAIYQGHSAAVSRVAISPDGQHVATGSTDGSIRLWPRDLGPAIERRKPREFTTAEMERYELQAGPLF